MLENSDKNPSPLDCEATIVGEEFPNFKATDVPPSNEDPLAKNRTTPKDTQSAAVVTLVNKFLAKAVEKKAIQVEIEPEENFLSIRYSQGDRLQPLVDPLPKKFTAAIISRLKLMAELDTNINSTPQKGRIRKRGGGRTINFFVQTQPNFYGEKLILRVLDSAIKPPSLTQLIENEEMRQSLTEMSNHDSGLLLVNGSHDSDLSSLFYGLLSQDTSNPKKIATIESLIRHILPEITQIEVDTNREEDYSETLQSFLEQDKQKIVVDHLPNSAVANMVVEMARNDHFMLASMKANNSINAIAQLSQMVAPELLADTLVGVLHQHTIRRLCPTCRTAHTPSQKELEQFAILPADATHIDFYEARSLSEAEIEQAQQKGQLCRQCNGTGYHGEIKVYELLQGTQDLKQAIAQADPEQLKQVSFQQQTSPLAIALDFVYQGQTTLTELARLFPDYLQHPTQSESVKDTDTATDLTQRLEKVEQLLMALTDEFIQLKQELNQTPIPEKVSHQATNRTTDSIDEAFKETYIMEKLPPSIDLSQETIVAESASYEELTDPGDWNSLKRDLDPSKETIAADFFPDAEESTTEEDNPFKSMPDPWS